MGIVVCHATVEGISPIGFSKAIQSVRNTGEGHDAFEDRTWRERLHTDKDGFVLLPGQAVKNSLSDVAKFLSESVPGKGKATFTKHFEAGTMVTESPQIMVKGKPIKAETVVGVRLFVPASGKRGDGKRVWKTFPVLPEWSVSISIHVLDPTLTDKPEKVREYLTHAGQFIGWGFWRPRNNGCWGRFAVKSFSSEKIGA